MGTRTASWGYTKVKFKYDFYLGVREYHKVENRWLTTWLRVTSQNQEIVGSNPGTH